jgi:type II secretory pathway pseudopilin PulG
MKQSSTRLGFTFVEVLAAMVFLGILIPVVISALTVSNRAAVVAERSTIAMQLGENRLSELMLEDAWTTAESRGDFGQEWPGYRWELKRQDWQSGAMTELTLDVFFVVQGQEHEVRLSTLTNESLKQS